MKKILLVLIGIFILTGCSFYDEYEMPEEVTLKTKEIKFEVYSKPKISDLIEEKNVKIINEDEVLNTDKTGKKKTTIEYEYDDRTYKYDVEYNIEDTTSPTILYTENYNYAYVGDTSIENTDLCESAVFIDNYDRKVSCKVEGTYDINTPGSYDLKYIISDKDNNVIEDSITFEVIDPETIEEDEEEEIIEEEQVEIEETDSRIQFSDIIKNYKNKNNMIGIDVSRWQGDIDFEKVKKAGAEFVIMRMAVSNGPDDPIGLDSKFKQNIKKAKKAGLKIGVYIYTSPSTVKEIKKQAEFVANELDGTKLDFPIAYDFENWEDVRKLKLNIHDLTNMMNEFYKIVNKEGYDLMLYSSKYYLEKIWGEVDYPVWLAHYTDQTNYQGNYDMWQMTSDGIIDGVDGSVDIDIYYKKQKSEN